MPKPYHDDLADKLRGRAIQTILWRHLQIIPFEMSHDECLELLAPAEHIPVLKSAAQYADISAGEGYMQFDVPYMLDGADGLKCQLMMRTHEGQTPPLRPRTPYMQLGKYNAQKKITDWLEARLVAGRMAATAEYMVTRLQEACDRGDQVRYLWPCITHLMKIVSNDEGEDYSYGKKATKWLDQFGHFKAAKNTPALSPQFKKALQETSTWITQGALLDHVATKPLGLVAIHQLALPGFELDGAWLERA